MSHFVRTTCPRDCYDGCGIAVELRDGQVARVLGDPDHPVSRGMLEVGFRSLLDACALRLERGVGRARVKHETAGARQRRFPDPPRGVAGGGGPLGVLALHIFPRRRGVRPGEPSELPVAIGSRHCQFKFCAVSVEAAPD